MTGSRRDSPGAGTRRDLVVLQSFPEPRPTTNPYLVQLRASLDATPGVRVQTFSWRAALTGDHDVFHVHWPEILLEGSSPARAAVRRLLAWLLVSRLRVRHTPVVATVHNLRAHEPASGGRSALLRALSARTVLRVRINTATRLGEEQPSVLVPHGHYRDWFARYDEPATVPGRVLSIGLLRPYKGTDVLLRAFAGTRREMPDATLVIAGRPSTSDLATELRQLATHDDRVRLDLRFVSDAEFVREVGLAELVALPHRGMHNSGGALAALSLARPVLVPDNEANRLLGAEVGPGWVHTYPGELTAGDLLDALHRLRSRPPARAPDLSAREWDAAGSAHLGAYRRAVELAHHHRVGPSGAGSRWAGHTHRRDWRP